MECRNCPFFRKGRCCHYTSIRPCTREEKKVDESTVYQFEFEGNYGLSVATKDWANAIKQVADLYEVTYTIRKQGQSARYEKGKRVR
jgi:hypothetical protein